MTLFIPGGTPHNGLHGSARKGYLSWALGIKKVEISLAVVYGRVGVRHFGQ